MATIKASGETVFGKMTVQIDGEYKIEKIKSSNKVFEDIARGEINRFQGTMANAYRPNNDTMLLAYLYICDLFGGENVEAKNMQVIPQEEEGVLY